MSEQDLKYRIKQVIVKGLKLKRDPESIPDQDTLFGGGLNLDSIDILTLIAALEDEFKIRIQDQEVAKLNSVNEIALFITGKETTA